MAVRTDKIIKQLIYEGTDVPLNKIYKSLDKTVIFMSDNVRYAIASVKNGVTITAPVQPTKSGYTFRGWGASASATSFVTFPYTPTEEKETLYAVWEAGTYTLYENGVVYVPLDATPNLPNGNWDGATPAAVFGASDITLQQSANSSTLWRLSGVASENKVDITSYNYLNVTYDVTVQCWGGRPSGGVIEVVPNQGIVEISPDGKGFRNATSTCPHVSFDIHTEGVHTFSMNISQYTGQYYYTVIVYTGQGDGYEYLQFGTIKVKRIWLSTTQPT